MASTPEGRVKAHIDTVLKTVRAYYHKPVQNGLGAPALDYHVCHKGFYAAVEAKRDDKAPVSVRQVRTMQQVAAAGGSVFLITGEDTDDYAQLVAWGLSPSPGFISRSAREYVDIPWTGIAGLEETDEV